MELMKNKILFLKWLIVLGFLLSGCASETWEDISSEYEHPEWFRDAKFGIFSHWGAQTKPDKGGGWYARHLYIKNEDLGGETFGRGANEYHLKHYGHPSRMGYKDVIHSWKADKLDADDVVKSFKEFGAKYVVVLAVHHDHFDNWDSSHHEWNSVNMGPNRDIVGEFGKALKKHDLYFGVSTHDNRFPAWISPAFGADKSGPLKGVPYDAHLTKADGKGKWWEGFDPANLYGLSKEKQTPEWLASVKKKWLLRHLELVNKYDVDMLWFDSLVPVPSLKTESQQVAAQLFKNNRKKHGSIQAIITGKRANRGITEDIEQGRALGPRKEPWQGIINFTRWFYKIDTPYKQNTRSILEQLVDSVSKNGNLLICVELYPDGRIVKEQKEIMVPVGEWLKINGEAIYKSRPWKIFGDGPLASHIYSFLSQNNPDKQGLTRKEKYQAYADEGKIIYDTKRNHIGRRGPNSKPYDPDDVRYTTQGNILYMTVLNPKPGWKLLIPTLGKKNPLTKPSKITSITMLAKNPQEIPFQQKDNHLTLTIPIDMSSKYPVVFKIIGAIK